MEVWAALSSAVLLLILLLLVVFQPEHWFAWLVWPGVIFGAIEATARRHLAGYLLTITIVLALLAAAILVVESWRWIVAFALAAIMVHTIWGNLRELRGASHAGFRTDLEALPCHKASARRGTNCWTS